MLFFRNINGGCWVGNLHISGCNSQIWLLQAVVVTVLRPLDHFCEIWESCRLIQGKSRIVECLVVTMMKKAIDDKWGCVGRLSLWNWGFNRSWKLYNSLKVLGCGQDVKALTWVWFIFTSCNFKIKPKCPTVPLWNIFLFCLEHLVYMI